jgi:hypothetical protein|tara:strand:+ start:1659 stop:1913 length:255 start_codon:yes stop_codon:yes gene_type:complete
MIASAMDLAVSVIWLASSIAVLASVILLALVPSYSYWIESKGEIDMEDKLYELVMDAAKEASEIGGSVEIRVLSEDGNLSKKGN